MGRCRACLCTPRHTTPAPHLLWSSRVDPAVIVSFPLHGDADSASLVAWTTTPWTLPSNLALCVNAGALVCAPSRPGDGGRPRPPPPNARTLSIPAPPRSRLLAPLLTHAPTHHHPEFEYVKARDPATGAVYIVAEARLAELPGAVPKKKAGAKGCGDAPKGFEVRAAVQARGWPRGAWGVWGQEGPPRRHLPPSRSLTPMPTLAA